jgi:homoaconitate hydratase
LDKNGVILARNLIEKIVQQYTTTSQIVQSGDFVTIEPAHVMTHDNTGAVMVKFGKMGMDRIRNPRQPVFTLDHNIQDKGETNLAKYRRIEAFAKTHGVDFYPAGRGIGHQVMIEEGYIWPGTMAVAADSHANIYGGLGCLGTPVVRTDAAALWASGQTWWQIPPVAKVELTGKLRPGCTGKDVIIALCGLFRCDEVLNHAIEFCGDAIAALTIDQRFAIANMTTEWGALAGVFPCDAVTRDWFSKRIATIAERGIAAVPANTNAGNEFAHPRLNQTRLRELPNNPLVADPDAFYHKIITLDLSTISPVVSGPNSVKKMTIAAVLEQSRIAIQKAYLVSCVNSRLEDILVASETIGDHKIASGVDFYIAAASSEVQADAEAAGAWQKLVRAGAKTLPPGCGPCIGLGAGLLRDGEVGIAATNRNFKGRMGSPNAEAYLASPAVVAASAVRGFITGLDDNKTIMPRYGMTVNAQKTDACQTSDIYPGFPAEVSGRLLFLPRANIDTDGIYPGKYTYIDDRTASEQAAVVMANYDPGFARVARPGDIIAGTDNFGTGSSREQAVTALQAFGIRLVIAASFSATYQRNAVNNGFITVTSPELMAFLAKGAHENLTNVVATECVVRFDQGTIEVAGQSFLFAAPGLLAQKIIVAGGLENWVRQQLS